MKSFPNKHEIQRNKFNYMHARVSPCNWAFVTLNKVVIFTVTQLAKLIYTILGNLSY